MVWKVRADCTYSSSGNKNSRMSAVQTLVDSYPSAIVPAYAETYGRFPGGITTQSNTRFTVAYDFDDEATGAAFFASLLSTLAAAARSQTMASIHEAGTPE